MNLKNQLEEEPCAVPPSEEPAKLAWQMPKLETLDIGKTADNPDPGGVDLLDVGNPS